MAEERLRWGILGAAAIARRAIVPAIQSAGDVVIAVGTRDHAKGLAFAKEFGIETVYDSYHAVLADRRVEAVYIPLPNDLHPTWTIAAAQAGKHVLCEKPLALTAAQAQEMVDASRRANIVLAEAVFFRCHPRLVLLKRMLSEGTIGRIKHLDGAFSFHLALGQNIRWERSMGGGALYDIGSHVISLVRFILEKEPAQVSAVMQMRGDVDIATAASLSFADDTTANVFVRFDAGQYQSLIIVGDTGVVKVPRPIATWVVGGTIPGPARPFIIERDAEETVIQTPVPLNAYEAMVKSFKRSVRFGDPVFLSGEDGVANLRVIEACQASAAHGRSVPVSAC